MQPMSPAGAATPAPQSAAISPRTRAVLQAPILPTLLRLAVPSVLVTLVTALSSTVDAVFVSRLGPDALAGVSLVFPVWMLMTTMSAGGFGGGGRLGGGQGARGWPARRGRRAGGAGDPDDGAAGGRLHDRAAGSRPRHLHL